VKVKRVGGVSKHKANSTGKIVTGSCDGVAEDGNFCVEVKVLTSEYSFNRNVDKTKEIPKGQRPLREILRGINDAEIGYLVFYYTIDSTYYEFKIDWENYQSYFDTLYC